MSKFKKIETTTETVDGNNNPVSTPHVLLGVTDFSAHYQTIEQIVITNYDDYYSNFKMWLNGVDGLNPAPDKYFITGNIQIPAGTQLILDTPFTVDFNVHNLVMTCSPATNGSQKLTVRIN